LVLMRSRWGISPLRFTSKKNKQSFVLGVPIRDKMREREREACCLHCTGGTGVLTYAMQCNAAAYASRLDLSPVSLKPKAAIERRRERTYVHSQYCMAGSHRVDHYMQIELANVQDHTYP
jgi:hypothetical protein